MGRCGRRGRRRVRSMCGAMSSLMEVERRGHVEVFLGNLVGIEVAGYGDLSLT